MTASRVPTQTAAKGARGGYHCMTFDIAKHCRARNSSVVHFRIAHQLASTINPSPVEVVHCGIPQDDLPNVSGPLLVNSGLGFLFGRCPGFGSVNTSKRLWPNLACEPCSVFRTGTPVPMRDQRRVERVFCNQKNRFGTLACRARKPWGRQTAGQLGTKHCLTPFGRTSWPQGLLARTEASCGLGARQKMIGGQFGNARQHTTQDVRRKHGSSRHTGTPLARRLSNGRTVRTCPSLNAPRFRLQQGLHCSCGLDAQGFETSQPQRPNVSAERSHRPINSGFTLFCASKSVKNSTLGAFR